MSAACAISPTGGLHSRTTNPSSHSGPLNNARNPTMPVNGRDGGHPDAKTSPTSIQSFSHSAAAGVLYPTDSGSSCTTDSSDCRSYETEATYEHPQQYIVAGGLHPLEIGDTLDGRYRIIHKLGHGAFSVVWLAENLKFSPAEQMVADDRIPRYVALKVWAARARESATDGAILRVVTMLADGARSYHRGRCHVVRFYEQFHVSGPNGTHQVHVLEAAGPTLGAIMECRGNSWFVDMTLDTKARLVREVAEGLVFLHSVGVVHADLHVNNIALALPIMDHLSPDEVLSVLGKPASIVIVDAQCVFSGWGAPPDTDIAAWGRLPSKLVRPPSTAQMVSLCTGQTNVNSSTSSKLPHIRLLDFSESFLASVPPMQDRLPGTPNIYSAPELLARRVLIEKVKCQRMERESEEHGSLTSAAASEFPLSFGLDTWAFGAIVYHIFSSKRDVLYWPINSSPFLTHFPLSTLHGIFIAAPDCEHIPEAYWSMLAAMEHTLVVKSEDGGYKMEVKARYWRRRMSDLHPEVKHWVGTLLLSIAVVDPKRRSSMKEVLDMIPESG